MKEFDNGFICSPIVFIMLELDKAKPQKRSRIIEYLEYGIRKDLEFELEHDQTSNISFFDFSWD